MYSKPKEKVKKVNLVIVKCYRVNVLYFRFRKFKLIFHF